MLPLGEAAASAGGGQDSDWGYPPAAGPEAAPTHPGRCPPRPVLANRKARRAGPALRPAPTLPGSNSPFSFRPSAAFRLPSGPFKNGTTAASLPARRQAEPPPPSYAAAAGRHVTVDGGLRGSKLAETRARACSSATVREDALSDWEWASVPKYTLKTQASFCFLLTFLWDQFPGDMIKSTISVVNVCVNPGFPPTLSGTLPQTPTSFWDLINTFLFSVVFIYWSMIEWWLMSRWVLSSRAVV